jgi:hypothetical protein
MQYAYDNMIYFHVQRLSGGFVLTSVTAVVGLIAFTISHSIYTGLVFFAYLMAVATYLILLGKLGLAVVRCGPAIPPRERH